MRLLERLTSPAVFARPRGREVAFLLVPLALWIGMLLLRPVLIHPSCDPALAGAKPCIAEGVPSFDRMALGLNSAQADEWSYWTQNTSGIIAAAAPVVFNIATAGLSPPAFAATVLDWVILGETVIWNGATGEITRALTQRPRPFVYADPHAAGPNPAHYISFYSGHTSFAAASLMALLLIFAGRRAPLWLLCTTAALYEALTFSTGIFRVLAGRHFPTDVIGGALIGSALAIIVAALHRSKSQS